jgi:hypothetical protein
MFVNEQIIGIHCSGATGATPGLALPSGNESKSEEDVRVRVLHDVCVRAFVVGKMVV